MITNQTLGKVELNSGDQRFAEQARYVVSVDVVVFSVQRNETITSDEKLLETKVLLVRRTNEPFQGEWALPGGFVNEDESLETAARRVLAERTGLQPTYIEQLYTFGLAERDPRGRVISVSYYALVPTSEISGVTNPEAAWFSVEHIPADLAFDHTTILDYGLTRLRNKVSYANIAYHFLPPVFTLAQLREVYEAILGPVLLEQKKSAKLDPSNFKRKVEEEGGIVPTGTRLTGGRHRPPQLYRCVVQPSRGPAA